MVERELARGREKRFLGSVWRLGRVELTRTDGQLTDGGRVFQALRPSESLSSTGPQSVRLAARSAPWARVASASSAVWSTVQ